jgi:deoxycytidylate deaminase
VNAIVKFLWDDKNAPLRASKMADTIDYVRAIHAEMAAITDAGRHGINLKGTTLYTTTFPCHDCSKHIVASGIKRVVYFEPYPKSLTADLYRDSIQIDALRPDERKVQFRSFVGVAPSRYLDFFTVGKRERKDSMTGRTSIFNLREESPVLPQAASAIEAMLNAEKSCHALFDDFNTSRKETPNA